MASKVKVDLGERSYVVHIGACDLTARLSELPQSRGAAVIITNQTVGPLYGGPVAAALAGRHTQVHSLSLPDGEAYKTWDTLHAIHTFLLQHHCDRHTTLYALGGGVVGDIAGFAAATFMRGVPFVQIPTTLLAMVDSSVGGKTAVNHPLGKNMIGAFHQPSAVIADLATLDTLSARERSAGLAEVIKYGCANDAALFAWLEAELAALLQGDRNALEHAVARSVAIKAAVVAQDETEQGARAVLNFGHTFGHAIEAGLGFGQWLHGEAVGCGMVLAARLSERLGTIDAATVQRIRSLVQRAGLPVDLPQLPGGDSVQRYLDLMRGDKKAADGAPRFVVLTALGAARLERVPEATVRAVLSEHLAAAAAH